MFCIIYSNHAKKRIKERGIEEWEIEQILKHPLYTKKSFENRKVVVGETKNKKLKIIFIEEENYIKVISVMYL